MKKPEIRLPFKLPRLPFGESAGLKTLLLIAVIAIVSIAIAIVDLSPGYSHLDGAPFYSGAASGHYYTIANELARLAATKRGRLVNRGTVGSAENIERLSSERCETGFALVQDGLPWPKGRRPLLIGQLPRYESLFFLGLRADEIRSFEDLRGKTIGIGPAGSGTYHVAKQILEAPDFRPLNTRLVPYGIDRQLELLAKGQLDLGAFVIDEDSQLIKRAVREVGLQIASFAHTDVVARQFAFAMKGRIGAGQYHAIRLLPKSDKHVLHIRTLVVASSCTRRSQIMAMMGLLADRFPTFVQRNRLEGNQTALTLAPAAREFLQGDGIPFSDNYLPWLVNVMPPSNWVHIVMALSILFNLMGTWHRFHLWRIDANRIKAELLLTTIFGTDVTVYDLERGKERETTNLSPEQQQTLRALISRLVALEKQARRASLSVTVPMGAEMAYRYQEGLIKHLRSRLVLLLRPDSPSAVAA
jgi:hypothetical protein